MMERVKLGRILKIPAILVLVLSFFGGIYAAVKGIGGIGIVTPIVIGIVIVLYFIGENMQRKGEFG